MKKRFISTSKEKNNFRMYFYMIIFTLSFISTMKLIISDDSNKKEYLLSSLINEGTSSSSVFLDKIGENDSLNVLSKTPKIYQDLGLNDLPMTITKNHTVWAMEKQDKNTHGHDIEKEILKQIPEALTKPLNIVKSGSRNDSIVVITELSNSNGDLIVVPIKIDGKSNVNQIEIDSNVLTSIYGKDNDYDGWMRRNQEMGRILYDKDDGIIKKYRDNPPRLQLPNDTISTINNIIQQDNNYVNSVQNSQKSTKIDKLKENKTVIPFNKEVEPIQKHNIIDEKVAEYVESVKDNFETNIDINTKVVNEGNVVPVDYKKEKQATIYKRARDIFGKIGKKVFTNKNDSEKIYVSNTDINESIRKTVTNLDQKKYLDENMAVFSQLDKIIENGKEIGSSIQDTKGREYKDYKYYVTNARINGENCVIEYDTRIEEHNKINERHFRLERVYKVNEGDLVTGADKKSPNQFVPKSPSVNNIIQQDNNYVNSTENSQKSTKIDKLTANAPFSPEFKAKQRKRYKTIIESDLVSKEAKMVAKELMGVDTYVPESNVNQLRKADYTIEQLGTERALESLKSKIDGGQKITGSDIALGDRLIQYYSKTGEKARLQDAIQYTAMAGTEAGRTVQAMSIIAHQSPEGQTLWIERSVDKLNQKIASKKGAKIEVIDGKKVAIKNGKNLDLQLFEFTADMQEKLMSVKSNEEMYSVLDEIYEELGQQVPKRTIEKIDSWRYFSMLANPTTHVRNIAGNTAMTGIQSVKNVIAGGIEDIVSLFNKDMERSKSVVRLTNLDKATLKFAMKDIKNVADRLGLNQNKYSPTSRIESNKREFKSNILNKTLGLFYKLNSKFLEVEDGWGLKFNYAKELTEYIVANKYDVNNITDEQLGKARNYAIEKAKEATFHQESKLASAINQIGNNNEITKFILDSTLLFTFTNSKICNSRYSKFEKW